MKQKAEKVRVLWTKINTDNEKSKEEWMLWAKNENEKREKVSRGHKRKIKEKSEEKVTGF